MQILFYNSNLEKIYKFKYLTTYYNGMSCVQNIDNIIKQFMENLYLLVYFGFFYGGLF